MVFKTPTEYLDEQFDIMMSLNPYREDLDRAWCISLARDISPDHWNHFRRRTEKLLKAYTASRWKQSENATVEKYLARLNHTAHRLLSEREIRPGTDDLQPSVALVQQDLYGSLDWIRILEQAESPHRLTRAVDAASERNRMFETVLPIAFNVLHALDNSSAFAWELDYLNDNTGSLDADVVRDLLRSWQRQSEIPRGALEWALKWSMNENLERQWPGVVAASDRLLRNLALQSWFARHKPKSPGLQHLHNLFTSARHSELALRNWMEAAVGDVGQDLKRCISTRRSLQQSTSDKTAQAPLKASLARRLTVLERQFEPVLLLADLLIQKPDGVYWLALATLGMSHAELRRWRKKLEKQAYAAVQRVFLENLRRQVSPEDTIRKLTFGDKVLTQTLVHNLDLLTREFESINDRDAVAEVLAVNYASFRETELLGRNLSARYRQVMTLLHEDTLHRLLPDNIDSSSARSGGLRDLYSLTGDARRYLNRRQSQQLSAEALVSAEIDFARSIRRQRLRLIRTLLV